MKLTLSKVQSNAQSFPQSGTSAEIADMVLESRNDILQKAAKINQEIAIKIIFVSYLSDFNKHKNKMCEKTPQ